MFLTIFIVFFIGGVLQESKARSLSLSVNLSLALNDGNINSGFPSELLRNCMKETEISMAELNRFRLSLLSNDPDTVNGLQDQNEDENAKTVDYDGTLPVIEERNEESLQCFAHCLYEKLGLIKDGVFMEPDFFRKFYTVVEREKQPVRECMNLESNNNCEAAYKTHLCYSKLKTLEAERRIREILEYNDNNANNEADDGSDTASTSTPDFQDLDSVDPKDNEIDKN